MGKKPPAEGATGGSHRSFPLGAGNRAEGACGQPPLPIGKNTELPSASDIVLKAKDGTWVSPHHHFGFHLRPAQPHLRPTKNRPTLPSV
jgi:hypothetical protein